LIANFPITRIREDEDEEEGEPENGVKP
jgi:hypothetical protein